MDILEKIKRIKTIADIGLLYHSNGYEKERYEELQSITTALLSEIAQEPIEKINNFYLPVKEYPTVKIDVRGLLLNASREILLVRETSDQKWSLPGGWAEPGFSPSESIIKEIREETGVIAECNQLLAVFDIRLHPHPPSPYSVYKLTFHCTCTSENPDVKKGFDILDVNFFPISQLPELSENRILKSQIETMYRKVMSQDFRTYFD